MQDDEEVDVEDHGQSRHEADHGTAPPVAHWQDSCVQSTGELGGRV